MILETKRLYMREMTRSDFGSICRILQDEETMYAYEGAFSDDEVWEWIDRQVLRYQKLGYGLWAVILKESGELIGQCGLTMQQWKDSEVLEIGYLFRREYWHKGYATEAARACKRYAFDELGAEEVCSIIRDTNTASQKVALRNGMTASDTWTKHYRGVDMPHCRYIAVRWRKAYEFRAVIESVPDKGGAYIRFPYDIREEFGKGRVKVKATFDGEPYCGSIVNMGVKHADGSVCYIIGIRKDIRSRIGKQPGDEVFVTVTEAEDS